MTYKLLQENKLKFDPIEYKKTLIECYYAEEGSEKQKLVYKLFLYLANITIPACKIIYNKLISRIKESDFRIYESRSKAAPPENYIVLTLDDLISESYLYLVHDIGKLDLSQIDSFKFYYSKTLRNKFMDKFKNIFSYSTFDINSVYELSSTERQSDFEIDKTFLNLTELEEKIAYYKINQDVSVEEFRNKNNITSKEYYSAVKSLKAKLSVLREDYDAD